MNLCVILINSKDHFEELSKIFTPNDSVFDLDESNLIKIYKISDDEIINMSLEDIIIDRIAKLTVNY